MSKQVDEKVVQMEFENKDFNKNVDSSLKSISNLQSGLNGLGSSGGGLSSLAAATDAVSVKFSLLNAAVTRVFTDMVANAVQTGVQLTKSLSVDQVTAGYTKYEQKTTSIQTVMAAVKKEGETEEEALERVNEQINKLNWFSDETSYSLTDMTDNVGKFTSQGVELETAVQAMEGISTWASLSGQSTNEASRAMYNLSQALSAGSVKVKDWMSIENANMATAEFKNTAIETAIELGELSANTKVTAETFRDSLQDGWLTNDVLLATLQKYGSFADKLHIYTDETETTATEFQKYIKDWQAGTLSIDEFAETLGKDTTYVESALKDLGVMSETGEVIKTLGQKAFQAAQEAKTFTEVMNATKDAVSTEWLNIFEKIFGNYLQAKDMWTRLSNELWDVFAGPLDEINEMLGEWTGLEVGGRSDLIESLFNVLTAIENVIATVREAFQEIFPPLTAKRLSEIVTKFKQWSEVARDKSFDRLKSTLSNIFSLVSTGIGLFKRLKRSLAPAIDIIKGSLVSALDQVNSYFTGIGGAVTGHGLDKTFDGITKITTRIASIFADILPKAIGIVRSAFLKVTNFLFLEDAETGVSRWDKLVDIIVKVFTIVTNVAKTAINFAKNLYSALEPLITVAKEIFVTVLDSLLNVSGKLADAGSEMPVITKGFDMLRTASEKLANVLRTVFSKAMDFITPMLKKISDFMSAKDVNTGKSNWDKIAEFFGGVWDMLEKLGSKVFEILGGAAGSMLHSLPGVIDAAGKTAGSLLDTVFSVFRSVVNKENLQYISDLAGIVMGIAVKLGIASAAFKLKDLGGMFSGLKEAAYNLADGIEGWFKASAKAQKMKSIAALLLSFAAVIAAIGITLKFLSDADTDSLTVAVGSVTLVLLSMLAMFALMGKLDGSKTKKNAKAFKKMALGLSIIMLSLAVLVKQMQTLDQAINVFIVLMAVVLTCKLLLSVFMSVDYNKSKKAIKNFNKMALGFALIGIAIKILAKGIAALGAIPFGKGLSALGLLAAFVVGMSVLGKIAKNIKLGGLLKLFASMLLISIALGLLVAPLIALAVVDLSHVLKNVLIVLGVVSAFMLISAILGKIKIGNILKFTFAAIGLSIALGLLVPALVALQMVKFKNVASGVLAMVVALAALGLVGKFFAAGVLPALGFAAAMLLIGAAALMIGAGIALALGALTAFVEFFGANTALINQATTMLVDSLIYALTSFFDWLFGAVPTLIEKFLTGIVTAVANCIETILDKLGEILSALATFVSENLPNIITLIGSGLELILTLIADYTGPIIEAVFNLMMTLLEKIAENFEPLLDVVWDMLVKLWNFIVDKLPQIVEAVVKFVIQLIGRLADWLGDLIDAIVQFIIDFLNRLADTIRNKAGGLAEAIWNVVSAIIEAILTFLQTSVSKLKEIGSTIWNSGFVKGIREKISEIGSVVKEIVEKIKTAFKDKIKEFLNIGKDIIQGLKDGITGAWDSLKKGVTETASKVGNWFKEKLGIGSPSKVFKEYGGFIDQGLAIGLEDGIKPVNDAVDFVAEDVKDNFTESMNTIMDAIDTDYEPDLTITPVLDLTEIQNGAKQMQGMLGDRTMNVNGSYGLAASTARLNKPSTDATSITTAIEELKKAISGITKGDVEVKNEFNISGQDPNTIADVVANRILKQIEQAKAVTT